MSQGGGGFHTLSLCYFLSSQTTHRNGSSSMESSCPEDSKKYRLISMGGLWAEQFAMDCIADFEILKNCDFWYFENFW